MPLTTAQEFADYQESVASRLRYAIAQRNLADCHDLKRPRNVLDAGGGNGLNAAFLLPLGHTVTIFDRDDEMLARARARLDPLHGGRCQYVQGRLDGIAETLPARAFDLIVCHHVLEYIEDGLSILEQFHRVAGDGGELSLITLNPVSEVIRGAVFQHRASEALRKLDDLRYDARWFGQAHLYPLDDILTRASAAGWTLKDFRGVRVLSDYVPDADARAQEDALLQLETRLAPLEPYRRVGRYLQFCFAK